MTTPTTNLKMSDLQTEFGGANPISISEYYRGGTYVPIGTATSATDGVAISTSGTIRMGMFRGVSAAGIVSNSSFTIGEGVIAPNNVDFNLFFGSDGTMISSGSTPIRNFSSNWYSPTTAGIGSSYWIYVPSAFNTVGFSGITTNTWVPLSTSRTLNWFVNTGQTGNIVVTNDIRISSSSSGTPVVVTFTVTVDYERAI